VLDRCLWLVCYVGRLLEHGRIKSLVAALEARQEWELSTTNPVRAGQLQQQRRRLIQRFLDDPGYATEGFIRILHMVHSDVLPAGMHRRYLAGPYRRHQTILRAESLAHLTVAVLFALLTLLARLNMWVSAPTLMSALAYIWIALFLADVIWCVFLSRIARALLLNLNTNAGELFNELIDMTVEGMHWWQRPAASLIGAIIKRVGPQRIASGAASAR
jgi:hypothetical protein